MTKSFTNKLWSLSPFGKKKVATVAVKRLPINPDKRLIKVFVEGYEDVAFWRGIFDHFSNDLLCFEISVPNRRDMAKGKKVVLSMLHKSGYDTILCVDSDFDYLFGEDSEQSKLVNSSEFLFHTHAYATENYLCYAPSLHNVCVRATKNDTRIFDFEYFMAEYSRTIYPLFLWYAYSAKIQSENFFPLIDFKNSVKLNYVEPEENGQSTLDWLKRQVKRRLHSLEERYHQHTAGVEEFGKTLILKGVTPDVTYLFMQGHTLMDNVVMVLLNAVCERLRMMSITRIQESNKKGVAMENELSNYKNQLRNIRDVLLDNENYTDCFLYKHLHQDIAAFIAKATRRLVREGVKTVITQSIEKNIDEQPENITTK